MKDLVIWILIEHHLKNYKSRECSWYIAVGNANFQRKENELAAIVKKSNSAGLKLISTSSTIVDTKN